MKIVNIIIYELLKLYKNLRNDFRSALVVTIVAIGEHAIPRNMTEYFRSRMSLICPEVLLCKSWGEVMRVIQGRVVTR